MSYYKDKYIKYKNKYFNLRSQIGGDPLDELKKKISYSNTHCINPGDIFHQHEGECWSDSIQMLLCFSDELKRSVQNKLFNLTPKEIINMAYLESRSKFLAPIYRHRDEEEQHLIVDKFEKRLIKYLTLLQNRLCLHITDKNTDRDIPQCRHMNFDDDDIDDDSYPLRETYGKFLVREKTDDVTIINPHELYENVIKTLSHEQRKEIESQMVGRELTLEEYTSIIKKYIPKKYQLKKQISEITGIGSAIKGLKLINKKKKIDSHGASDAEIIAIINILSFSLLNENNVLTTKIIKVSELIQYDIDNSIGMIVGTWQHATSFFICDLNQIYYNNNFGKVKMSWKKLLTEYLKYKDTHTLILHWYYGGYLNIFKENGKDKFIVLDMDANIIGNGDNIDQFVDWKNGIVNNFIIIQKENLESKTDDEIYEKLEEQFTLVDIYNCSIEHTKNLNMIINGKSVLESLIYNLKYECNKKNFNKVLLKIDFSIINQDVKDRLLEIILNREVFDINDYDCIKILIDNNANIIFSDKYHSPLYLILSKKLLSDIDYKIIELLLERGQDINQFNTLEFAIKNENLDLLKFLIKNKADVNKDDGNDTNLLFNLVFNIGVNQFYFQAIKLLVESGANLAVKYYNMTLLESSKNNKDLIELFIKSGINVNEKYSNDEYPLIELLSASYSEDTKEILCLLINSGANVNIKSSGGFTLLELIIKHKYIDILKTLMDKGMDVNEPFVNGKYPLVNLLNRWSYDDFNKQAATLLINSGANITLPDNNLLKLALDVKDYDLIQLLINKGIDINDIIDGTQTALFYVIHDYSFTKNNVFCKTKILLKYGADVNKTNDDGETPLLCVLSSHFSIEDKIAIVDLLLKAGADITAKNKLGENIFDLIEYYPEIREFIDDYISNKK